MYLQVDFSIPFQCLNKSSLEVFIFWQGALSALSVYNVKTILSDEFLTRYKFDGDSFKWSTQCAQTRCEARAEK